MSTSAIELPADQHRFSRQMYANTVEKHEYSENCQRRTDSDQQHLLDLDVTVDHTHDGTSAPLLAQGPAQKTRDSHNDETAR